MQDTLIIVNPVAGKGRGEKAYKKIMHMPEISGSVVVKRTEFPGHAVKITRNYAASYRKIFIFGGDGTVNEVMNGLPTDKNLIVGVVPIGTGNDFAKEAGIPLKKLADFLNGNAEYELKHFGLFNVDFKTQTKKFGKRRFANALGIGFDALVAKVVNENKRLDGVIAYIYGVFKALRQYEFLNIAYTVPKIENISAENLLVTVGSGKTSGGGFYLTPFANIFDDSLQVTFISKRRKFQVITSLPYAIFNKLDKVKGVTFHHFHSFEIAFRNPVLAHLDGEVLHEEIVYAKVTSLNHSLKLIVPK